MHILKSGLLVLVCLGFRELFAQNSTLKNEQRLDVKDALIEPVYQHAGVRLPPFSQLAHGLSSGPIFILDNKTFFITDLYYDGKGPDAHFWVGKGIEPARDGILVPNENGSSESLPAYSGEDVAIRLPDNITIDQIDYFGMWCIRFAQNFGHVVMPWAREEEKPIELEPFKQLAHGLRSGPILIIDEMTFFIPNFHYDGKGPDAHFWVGNGPAPSTNGILVQDENGSSKSISAYTGQNIYIRLPHNGLTINKIDYFGVWCIECKQNFGHVFIPKGLKFPEARANPAITIDNKMIIHIPKCCPINQALTQNGCAIVNKRFTPRINVHEHNLTHLNDVPLRSVAFQPFVNAISCPYQKYPLIPNEDKFALLQNGSLMVLNKHEVLSQDGYCIETVNLGEDTSSNWITTPIVCFSNSDVPLAGTVFIVYASGVLLSAIFLIVTALVFLLIKEVRDTRGKCVVGYALSMAAAFICLASAQLSGIGEQACSTLGFFIQFFLASSFTWLSTLSWETYYKINAVYRKHNTDAYTHDRRRLYYYLGIGFFTPLLLLIITLIFDRFPGIPNSFFKPQFGKNNCWFDQKQWTMVYFYFPIAAAIVFNIILSVLMKCKLLWLEKHRKEDIAWLAVKHELKPMYRSCGFLLALMTLSWSVEIISFLAQTDSGIWTAIDIINSLQGFLVFLIFVLHRPVKNKLHLCKLRMARHNIQYDKPSEEEIRLNGLSGHNEFLTKLNRSESAEQLS